MFTLDTEIAWTPKPPVCTDICDSMLANMSIYLHGDQYGVHQFIYKLDYVVFAFQRVAYSDLYILKLNLDFIISVFQLKIKLKIQGPHEVKHIFNL